MLIEIHMIQNHSPSNLNRDDLGAPKTCIFGGVTRARISSQCLKRSIRNPANPDDAHKHNGASFAEALAGHTGWRTKFFPHLVGEQLKAQEKLGIVQTERIPEDEWAAIVAACTVVAQKAGRETKEETAKEDADPRYATKQLIFLSPRHAAEFVKKLTKLRGSDIESYNYFQDPRVVFTTLLEEELGKTVPDDEYRKRAAKNGWLIVKYPHRWQTLNEWVSKQAIRPSDSDETKSEGDNTETPQRKERPGQEQAKFLAQTLSDMISQAQGDKATRELLDDLLKAKAQKNKKWRGRYLEGPIEDERKKPDHYQDFQRELRSATGPTAVDIALFGCMTTSDYFEDVEAAMQVAHAISTHAVVNESDYWTAVDDLARTQASAHLGETIFNSACFYKYFCLDWDQFVRNQARRQ